MVALHLLHMRRELLLCEAAHGNTNRERTQMFQDFEVTASADTGSERVRKLRSQFDDLGIDCFLVPRSDRFQGEYVPDCEARLAWLTGFTGSAGVALIMRDGAHVFVDGRYTTQLRQQVDLDVFTPQDLIKSPPRTWLKDNAPRGAAYWYRSLAAHHH